MHQLFTFYRRWSCVCPARGNQTTRQGEMAEAARRRALALVEDRGESALPPGVLRRTSTVTYTYMPGPGSGVAMTGARRGGDTGNSAPAGGGVEFRSATVLARENCVDRVEGNAGGGGTVIGQSKRSYRDGSGVERLGVARCIGNTGRIIVRGTDVNGLEIPPQDLLINMTGSSASSAFDAEWNSRAAAIGGPDIWNHDSGHVQRHHFQTREVGRLMDDARTAHDARTRMFRDEAARLRRSIGEDRTHAGDRNGGRNGAPPPTQQDGRTLSAPRSNEVLARRLAREEEDRLWSRRW